MRINTNVSSLNAWRNLTATDGAMGKNLERLSSGFRINRAGDDVAGLAISENMRAQVKGLNQAVKNAQDGISLLQTAEGSLNEVHTMLHRMRELSVQSANGTLQPEDRKQIQTEMDNLTKEVTRITNATQFNSMDLVDGSLTKAGVRDVNLQIGPNGGQTLGFEIGAMDSKSLGIGRDVMTARVYKEVDVDGLAATTTDIESEDGGNFVDSVAGTGAVGAGMEAKEYTVRYDENTNTVQLFEEDSTGSLVSIGTSVKATADGEVTIGDQNTARTITIKLQSTLPSGLATGYQDDKIIVGSRSATVTDTAGTQTVIDTVQKGTGVTAVGWGLESGSDYTVEIVDADGAGTAGIQLFKGGTAIGKAEALPTAGNPVTIGDAATGRTMTVVMGASTTIGDKAQVTVTNNGQAAENAKFDGGVKYASSQVFAGLNVSSVDGAKDAIGKIDAAIGKVSYQRSQLGAITNRLEHTINNLNVVAENLTASESRIRDVDMALEMTQFTKQQILMQSGTAMLAQANQKNQAVLSLLR
ncbi:MAG TPA: flagellin [Symbiobacteriaceae bacterium]|nr:flagellin [Symbiobacteriaceae bacterium]